MKRLTSFVVTVCAVPLGAIAWVAPPTGIGQNSATEAEMGVVDDVPPTPHELPSKDIQPPVIRERKTSPPLPLEMLRVGPFQSVQVNVDEFGNNILGDAANEPSIAVDPNNWTRMAIGWRQFDTVASGFRQAGVGYSDDGGQTWTASTLDPGVYRSDPVLRARSDGTFFYYSLQDDFCCDFFSLAPSDSAWSGPVPSLGGDKAWFAIDRTGEATDGNIYVYWAPFACNFALGFARSFDGGQTFSTPTQVPSGLAFGTMSVDDEGTVHIASANNSAVVARSLDAQHSGVAEPSFLIQSLPGVVPGTNLVNPGGLPGQAWIACGRRGTVSCDDVYYLASARMIGGSNGLDVIFARSRDRGATWEPARRLNHQSLFVLDTSHQWFAMMDVAPNGRIDVLWNDTRSSTVASPQFLVSELYYAASFDGGDTWRYEIPVSRSFLPRLGMPAGQTKLGDYYDLRSDDEGVSVAYAATFNEEQDIYFLRVDFFDCNANDILDVDEIDAGSLLDCNGNDLPDSCEIATGYSSDCDANGIPDECDIATGNLIDCDGNEIADSCEVTAGTAPDCNQNGIPDSCDTATLYRYASETLAPFDANNPQTDTLIDPPQALSSVSIIIDTNVNTAFSGLTWRLEVDSAIVATFIAPQNDCGIRRNTLTVSASDFNALLLDGIVTILFTAPPLSDHTTCAPSIAIRYQIEYEIEPAVADDNRNGIPDACEALLGDLNCDGAITVSDIGPFITALVNPAQYAIDYPDCDINNADMNMDTAVTVSDIGLFISVVVGG